MALYLQIMYVNVKKFDDRSIDFMSAFRAYSICVSIYEFGNFHAESKCNKINLSNFIRVKGK